VINLTPITIIFFLLDSKYASHFTLCGQLHFELLLLWFFFTNNLVLLPFLVPCC